MKFAAFYIGAAILNSLAIEGARILSVFPYPGPSQYIFIEPLLKALAERGHEVTSISTFPQKEPLKNFRDVPIMENIKVFEDMMTEAAEGQSKSYFEEIMQFSKIGSLVVSNIFENAQVQQLVQESSFDLLIVEVLGTDALLGLGEVFKAPIVSVATFGTIHFIDYLVGNPLPLSYIPYMSLSYGNHMSLIERTINFGTEFIDRLCFNFFLLPHQEQLYKKYFPNAQIGFDEARRNVSLVLLNDHFTLRAPRPYVPNMVEVGGLHIKQKPNPLARDLQEFLDNAKEGAIYFSMGSNIKSKDLPPQTLKKILDVFRELKVKVLWKFEDENLPNKPDNVLVRKWFNQPSILAHPNVKLFISHGGYLSTTETIFHGKPVLGLPVIADQFMNIKNAIKSGYALQLRLDDLTRENFKESIEKLWNNPKYYEAAQRLSKRFRDQPLTPLETAIYWVEYVIRNEGAPYMRNAGQDLSFLEYHNLDVYLLLAMGMFLLIALMACFVRCLRNMCCKSKPKKSKVKKN
ncbi:UDP-glucosyltransferase 2 [Stomoxys calcitrans]|uniref:UDP-glucosyltransferase 2 n=1 Tax=Stomoxys calcitrans TaxID=35570 RepID=UPI0027E26353|nr:UDP-glucosyltransferase 2 [Stomoxys calcitrans]